MWITTGLGVVAAGGLAYLLSVARRSVGAVLRAGRRDPDLVTAFRVSSRCSIGEVRPDVLARVVGTVQSRGTPVTAPLSGTPCVYYALTIEREVGSEGRSTDWEVLYSDSDHVPFVVDDGARVLVESLGAATALDHDHTEVSGGLHGRPTDRAQALLDKYHDADDNPAGGLRRFRESIIAVGDEVAVVGSASYRDAPPGGDAYRAAGRELVFASNDVFKLAISNVRRFVRKR